jgi:uncharacterized cupin superfamily protein
VHANRLDGYAGRLLLPFHAVMRAEVQEVGKHGVWTCSRGKNHVFFTYRVEAKRIILGKEHFEIVANRCF